MSGLWASFRGTAPLFFWFETLENYMLEMLADPQIWIAFATLTALELVLGIDNIIFISILVDKLPVGDFSLHVRAYWPLQAAVDGTWTPPAVVRI